MATSWRILRRSVSRGIPVDWLIDTYLASDGDITLLWACEGAGG